MHWIRLLLFTLAAARSVLALLMLPRRFQGKAAALDGEQFEYHVGRYKRQVVSVFIAVSAPNNVRFVMRTEGRFDVMAKRLGIANEWQAGDVLFDESIYVLCDDSTMLRALSSDAELRGTVRRLAAITQGGVLNCYGGKLVAAYPRSEIGEAGRDTDECMAASAARRLLPYLQRVSQRLVAINAPEWTNERDPGISTHSIVITITIILSVLSFLAFLWVDIISWPRQLAFAHVNAIAASFAVGFGVILLLLTYSTTARTSRRHLVLWEILVGVPCAWYATRALLVEWNQRRDEAPVRIHEARVAEMYESIWFKSRRYFIVIDRWPDGALDAGRELRVGRSLYRRLRKGHCIRVNLHPGYFGDLWVSQLRHVVCRNGGEGRRTWN